MHPRENILSWNDRFRTAEEDMARSTDSSAPYWRFGDPLCEQVLSGGIACSSLRNRSQFTGTFFPFYRKASVFGLPRTKEFLPQWAVLSFLAGQAYGERLSKETEALFEGDRTQSQAAWDLLGALRGQLERTGVGCGRFAAALIRCCERVGRSRTEEMTRQILAYSQPAIWAGLLAATDARNDVLQIELLESVRRILGPTRLPLHLRAIINAAQDALNHATFDLLLHPLLDIACEKYVPTPLEGRVILTYLSAELRAFDRKGEADCPVGDRDLARWVADAAAYARRLADGDGDLLGRVFVETGQPRLRIVHKILQQVSAGIERSSPAHITNAILRWHKDTFGWSRPRHYGAALERIVHCVDMAIWLEWAPELSELPDVSSKRGMSM